MEELWIETKIYRDKKNYRLSHIRSPRYSAFSVTSKSSFLEFPESPTEAERLHCLRLYLFMPYIWRKLKNSAIILNNLPPIMKTAKNERVPPSDFLEEYFLPVIHLTPFHGAPTVCHALGTHFPQASQANIITHWNLSTIFPLPCALTLEVLCLECPCHIFTPAKLLLFKSLS